MNTKSTLLLIASLIFARSVRAEAFKPLSAKHQKQIVNLLEKVYKLRVEYIKKHPRITCLWERNRFSEFAGTPIHIDLPYEKEVSSETTNRKVRLARALHESLIFSSIFLFHLRDYETSPNELEEIIETLENIINDFEVLLK